MSELKKDFNTAPGTARLEAFSDGVFAIAITLLIIEIKVPTHEMLKNQTLFHYIWYQWPEYFAYVLSFINIGIYWANHHYLFKFFKGTDHIFNLLNVFFLMTIAFLPYPTGVLGEYILDNEHARPAVTFFSFAMCLPAIGFFLVWFYARSKKHIIDQKLSRRFISRSTILYLISNFLYIIAFVISFFSALVSITLTVALTLLYLLPPKTPEYND